MKRNKDLELFFELGSLRFLQRTWKQFLNADFQNITEHTFRIIFIALTIAKIEKKGDQAKIMKMALIHDIAESRTGDVNYLSRQYTSRDEDLGMKDMLAGTVLEEEFLTLWEEYERKDAIEYQIVKDADNLDVELEIVEQASRGSDLKKVWRPHRDRIVYNKFFTRTAQRFWKQIQTASPHDWHLKGRNRFNAGDWKKPK